MTVLIVDDEPLVRIALRMGIEWEKHGLTLVGEAPDGDKALAIVRTQRPDVVITDIKLPGMNGIELMRQIRTLYPETSLIALSAYDDYEYVRAAMKLGAYDYMLKLSLDMEELTDMLTAIAREREQAAQKTAEAGSGDTAPSALTAGQADAVLCVRPDGLNSLLERLQGKDAAAFAASMENLLKQLLADSSLPFVLYRGGRFEWMVLLACGADAQGWIRRVYQQMNGAFTLCFSVTVSVGAAVGKGFPNAPQAASRALDGRFLAEEPARLYFADAQPPEPPGLGLPPETEEALGHAMERGDAAALAETLQTLAQRLRMLAAGNAAYARGVWHETLFVLLRVLKGRGVSAGESGGELSARMDALERQTQVRDWLAERGALWIRQLAQQSAGQGRREVDQARALIAADLARDWSLRELAAQVALNESYLSALFSRKTGMSITRYTAMLRVEKAKALLRATDDRIGEIAARVGYADENYFCRIFKRMAGMTPNEYRRGRQREC